MNDPRQDDHNNVASTEFNDGKTQYESLTEGHTGDITPQQG